MPLKIVNSERRLTAKRCHPVNDDDLSAARRAGSSSRIAARCCWLASPQIVISARVRPHPPQKPLGASKLQILVQGESLFIQRR